MYIWGDLLSLRLQWKIAQSDGAIEYTDCTTAEG